MADVPNDDNSRLLQAFVAASVHKLLESPLICIEKASILEH